VAAVGAAIFWPAQALGRVAGPVGQSVGLRMAAGSGDLESMRRLLDAGIDPNTASSSGMTPLMDAAMNGRRDAVRLLLERGADPALQDDAGTTALDLARNADAQETIHLLKAHLRPKTSSH
jgi:ankyrin repeat protein